jgi:hypothetical protein
VNMAPDACLPRDRFLRLESLVFHQSCPNKSGRLSTFDRLVLSSLDQLLLIKETIFTLYNTMFNHIDQGALTKVEGSVHLTALYYLV